MFGHIVWRELSTMLLCDKHGSSFGKTMSTFRFFISYLILVCFQNVHASWWYLGVLSSSQIDFHMPLLTTENKCSNLAFLDPHQRKICDTEEKLLEIISRGASMGIEECQYQFRTRRWNCTTFNQTNVFGKVLQLKSRETAYIYAISSAGIVYSVTRACAKGDLDHCGCDAKVRSRNTHGKFEWGGCSENVRYGSQFSKDFLDTAETTYTDGGLMNLWNNEAGRKAIKTEISLLCKCHGVSGSCSVKICWRKMNSFRQISAVLKDKFDGASLVALNPKRTKLKRVNTDQKKPSKKDLVYLEESPDFCEYNPPKGSLGTRGRQCNKTSYGLDGCTLMCCGRGYYTIVKEVVEDCDCKFFWCCRVECKKCTQVVEMHYCN